MKTDNFGIAHTMGSVKNPDIRKNTCMKWGGLNGCLSTRAFHIRNTFENAHLATVYRQPLFRIAAHCERFSNPISIS